MEKLIEGYPAYKITDEGKIFSRWKILTTKPRVDILGDTWHELTQIYDKYCGYYIVTLVSEKGKRKNKRVHRLLMETFVPNPNNYPQVNHIDGNKLNNSLSNLEWCTAKHNTQEAIRLGLSKPKEQPSRRAVIQLNLDKKYIAEYASLHEAGEKTKVCWQNIYKVCQGIRPRAGGYIWMYKESVTTSP